MPIQTITIVPNQKGLLDNQKHTDWLIDQEQGINRNGRQGGVGGYCGTKNTKKGRSRNACRGKVRY